jgi:hypothetical protein
MRQLLSLLGLLSLLTNSIAQEPMNCAMLGDQKNVLPMGFLKNRSSRDNSAKVIPVVVHIVYTNTIENTYIDSLAIQPAIDQLNVDFEGTNISFVLVGYDYTDLSTYSWHNAYVSGQVCFPTYQTQATQLADDISWDISEYCNVYVIPKMCSTILGYAYVGYGPDNGDDGVWVLSRSFGVGDWPHLTPSLNENETLTHEMGHYCGLFHTFQGTGNCGGQDPNIPCEYENDYVCDTPPHKASSGCPGVSGYYCPTTIYDGALFTARNHMDYGTQVCRDEFTPGQIDRMHAMLEYQRYELYNDESVVPFCPGDFNGDGNIGTADLLTILSNYGCVGCGPLQGDVTLDYIVGVSDMNWILANWGETCGDGIGMLEGIDEKGVTPPPPPLPIEEKTPEPIKFRDLYAVLNSKPNSLLQVYDITGRKLVSSYVYVDIESLGLKKGIYIIELLSIDGHREILKVYLD